MLEVAYYPVGSDRRIHRLRLCRGVTHTNECPGYDTKQSDPEVPDCVHVLVYSLICTLSCIYRASRVFAYGPGDWSSIPGRVIPKSFKMVLDATLLDTQHYKVWIKGKLEQSRERSSTLPYTSV